MKRSISDKLHDVICRATSGDSDIWDEWCTLRGRIAELEAKAKELDALKAAEPRGEWEPTFAGMLDKYKELVHPYGYRVSPARQNLIDYVTELEAKAARWDWARQHIDPGYGLTERNWRRIATPFLPGEDIEAAIDEVLRTQPEGGA